MPRPRFKKGRSGSAATQFKPGQSGNPVGRAGKAGIRQAINEALSLVRRVSFKPEDLPESLAERGAKPEKDGRVRVRMPLAEALALRIISLAMRGNGTAIRVVMEYNSGKPPQTVQDEPEPAPLEDARRALREALEKSAAHRNRKK